MGHARAYTQAATLPRAEVRAVQPNASEIAVRKASIPKMGRE